jgi:hypothetical protein
MPSTCAARPELPAYLQSLLDNIREADAFELDARLCRAVAFEQRLDAEIGELLAVVAHEQLYRCHGFESLEAYAREHLGMAAGKARTLLRIERASELCPALSEAYREGRLTALYVAGGDVGWVRVPDHGANRCTDALRRAVSPLVSCRVRPVELNEHRIVDLIAEGARNGCQVRSVPIGGKLHAVGESATKIRQELKGGSCVPRPDEPRGYELGIRTNGRPGPHVPVAELPLVFLGYIFLFGIDKAPYLAALDSLARQVEQRHVLELRAGFPDLSQEAQDGPFGRAGQALNGSDAHALD